MNAREASRACSDHPYHGGDHTRPVDLRFACRHRLIGTGNFIPRRLHAVD
jgi:hypothetical protein